MIGDQTPPRHAWIGGFLDVNRDVVLLTCLDIVVSVVASAPQLDITVHTGDRLRTYFTAVVTMSDLIAMLLTLGYLCVIVLR